MERSEITLQTENRIKKVVEWIKAGDDRTLPKKVQVEFNLHQSGAYLLIRKARDEIVTDFYAKTTHDHIIETLEMIDDLIKNGKDNIKVSALKLRIDVLGLQAPKQTVNVVMKHEEQKRIESLPRVDVIDVLSDPIKRQLALEENIDEN